MKVHVLVLATVCTLTQGDLIPMSCKLIRSFVLGHNALRLSVAKGKVHGQPAATDMELMIWDDELAAKAAEWASNENMEHNPDRTIRSGRFETGENLYWQSSYERSVINVNEVLSSWFNEHKDFKFHPLDSSDFSPNSPTIGHYTQLVWAYTNRVGCAVAEYPDNGFESTLVVCNYGPAGNMEGEKPYSTGSQIQDQLICEKDCSHLFGSKC